MDGNTFDLPWGRKLRILRDDDCTSPREWDNTWVLRCGHDRHRLGDEQSRQRPEGAIVVPLYIYDHGGVHISTQPFSSPGDSGQVGWAYVGEDDLRDEFQGDREKALRCLEGEVRTYDLWLNGYCWGWEIFEENLCSACGHLSEATHESCWGYIGEDPVEAGIVDDMILDDEDRAALEEAIRAAF